MIYELSISGETKKEYIESVIEVSKQIFNDAFAGDFFNDDNLKVAFCNSENTAVVYESFCEQFFPLYLAERYSRTNFFAAQSMTNMDDGVYGILVCLDTPHEGDEWYQIILHEMSHIFCIAHEIGGENFQDTYSKENLGNSENYWYSSIGYAIWREFIADYFAFQINPLKSPLSLAKLREVVRELDEGINTENPDRAAHLSLMLSYIFLSPKVWAAADADTVVQLLERNRVFATKERSRDYHELIRLMFGQLKQKPCWEISFEFIEKLGRAYMGLLNW